MNISTGLLFQQGCIADPTRAPSLAGVETADGQARPVAKRRDQGGARNGMKPEKRACFRRGSVFDVCSVALSPFR